MMKSGTGSLWLASKSARRAQLLADAGIDVCARPADVDDGDLVPGATSPEGWVMALAYLKARCVADALRAAGETSGFVLGADTVCVHDGAIIGQPVDAADARRILVAMRRDAHEVLTGVCLIDLASAERTITLDRATVHMGDITDEQITAHITSGAWDGKAGAYNFDDQLAWGWELVCDGDATTVTGLPMQRLDRLFALRGVCG